MYGITCYLNMKVDYKSAQTIYFNILVTLPILLTISLSDSLKFWDYVDYFCDCLSQRSNRNLMIFERSYFNFFL